jgi:hypothetical protein
MLQRFWSAVGRGALGCGVALLAMCSVAVAQQNIDSNFDVAAFCSDCDMSCGAGACEPSCGLEPSCDAYCEPSCACGQPTCGGACYCPAGWEHRTGVFGEWLYLHPVGADMHHAQQQNGTGGAGTTPFGEIASADPQFSPGFRVGGSIALGACSSITGSYLLLDTDSRSSIDVPATNLQTSSLVHHPGAGVTSSAGPLSANYDIDFQLADVMYRRLLVASKCGWLNYSAGAGYARIDQEFLQTGAFAGSQNGNIVTATEIDFDGAGLRFGLDGERKIGHGRLSGYFKGNASALFGEARADYRMTNATTPADLAIVRLTDDRVVSTLEYELGVNWTSCSGRMRASVGYTGMHFFNMATTSSFIDAVQANNYTDFSDTISLEGLVTRFEVRY